MTGVDGPTFLDRRRRQYLAQTLEAFEELIEPHLPPSTEGAVREFKGLVRGKLNALMLDAHDLMKNNDVAINGFAVEVRDRLFPNGRRKATRP